MRSFGYAFSGLGFVLRTQHNAWIHLVATLLVIVAAASLNVSAADWRWLIVAICLVWTSEALNTAVEYVCDKVTTDYNVVVKRAKDIAAGIVLLSALSSVWIGALTLLPYLHRFLGW